MVLSVQCAERKNNSRNIEHERHGYEHSESEWGRRPEERREEIDSTNFMVFIFSFSFQTHRHTRPSIRLPQWKSIVLEYFEHFPDREYAYTSVPPSEYEWIDRNGMDDSRCVYMWFRNVLRRRQQQRQNQNLLSHRIMLQCFGSPQSSRIERMRHHYHSLRTESYSEICVIHSTFFRLCAQIGPRITWHGSEHGSSTQIILFRSVWSSQERMENTSWASYVYVHWMKWWQSMCMIRLCAWHFRVKRVKTLRTLSL